MTKPRVLSMCTHDCARSRMAEGLLRELAGGQFDAYSVGLAPTAVDPLTIEAMRLRGIDISSQGATS